MRSTNVKISFELKGRKTSLCLEEQFFDELKNIANRTGVSVLQLISSIDTERDNANRSSAIRVFVIGDVMRRAKENLPAQPLGEPT